jgi:hypothetical protein
VSTVIDDLMEDKTAQEFWLRRLVAVVIDYAIFTVPVSAFSAVIWSAGVFSLAPWFVVGVLVLLYSAFLESQLSYTFGKFVMNLRVISLDGRSYDITRALERNISKIHWIILVLDTLAGLLAEQKPNMRFLDTVVNCEVVDAEIAKEKMAAGVAPPPMSMVEEGGVVVETPPTVVEPKMPPVPEPAPETPAPEPPAPAEEPMEVEPAAPGIPPPPVPDELELEEIPEEEGPEEPTKVVRTAYGSDWEEMGEAEELPDED